LNFTFMSVLPVETEGIERSRAAIHVVARIDDALGVGILTQIEIFEFGHEASGCGDMDSLAGTLRPDAAYSQSCQMHLKIGFFCQRQKNGARSAKTRAARHQPCN